ncbi:MAG: mycofactocin-coupled SDR family oxidoreductase [Mycobacteriaceae bacterium]
MGTLDGKVALITGAARGQGRSHAIRLAQEGADIIAVDICAPVSTVPYDLAASEDLAQTATEVKALGRRVVTAEVDVRDGAALRSAVDDGVAQLGRLDIVCANAGITAYVRAEEMTDAQWDDLVGINLTGVFRTASAAIKHLKANDGGGSIVITSSTQGLRGAQNIAHYVAAKHGLVGLTKALALEWAVYGIRVNSVHPTSVDTPMIHNEATYGLFRPDLDPADVTIDDVGESFAGLNVLPVRWVEPEDVSNAVAWLVSDQARYITGVQLPVDAGAGIK